ncbi:MAG: dethiobiotin synthase [Pirellulaceae bacterium]|nr:dethiobiotin synthase [Pirellulaceae bacterium]
MTRATPGLFIVGTNTEVGKTYIASLIIQALVHSGVRVGVYKPAASDCPLENGEHLSADAQQLWEAAGQPGSLEQVCPQRFVAPLAPHLAAQAEGGQVDAKLLRTGLNYWQDNYDFVVVEGIGGLMSPVSDEDYVADLAYEFGYPLLLVASNELGCINQTLQTLITAAAFEDGLPVVGTVLNNRRTIPTDDISQATNFDEITRCSGPPVLASVTYQGSLDSDINWFELGAQFGSLSRPSQ